MELFIRVSIFEVVTLFFSFSVAVPMYKIHDLDEGFSFLATVANDSRNLTFPISIVKV